MEPLHAIFDSYKLDDLDKSWTEQVWKSDFTNIEDVPVEYLMFLESSDMSDLLDETCATVKDWIAKNGPRGKTVAAASESSSDTTEVSWQTLLAMNLDVRALLAVITYLTRQGQAFDASQDLRQVCLRATSLYFILLAVPGSQTFQAFHPSVYEIALKTLSLSRRLMPLRAKSTKRCEIEDNDEDENEDEQPVLSGHQSATLTRGLNGVLYDLVVLLASANLSLEAQLLDLTVYNLVEITKLADETVKNFQESARISQASLSSLAYNAYVALRALCEQKEATMENAAGLIGKYFLPLFLIGNVQLPPRQMAIIRESTIHFFKTLLQQHEKYIRPTLTTLIQHLMMKSPDRLEGRQKQAVLVIKLINLCTSSSPAFASALRDLVKLSNHNRISCRIFAQEIIGRYLLELSTTRSGDDEDNSDWPTSKTKKLLLASALSRCVDVSSMVRGRAIATFAEYTDSIDDPAVRELFLAQRESLGEELPSLADLVDAIDSGNVDSVLPDLRGIVNILRHLGEDERALVRKNALQALRNGVLINDDLTEEATRMIRSHCRDATLTVRKFGIRALTTLLERFPRNSSLCKDWVNFVVPRVFDAEAKVQEEVLDSLEKLTIAKIQDNENRDENPRTDLPWKILREIAACKMSEHLTRACKIWIDSKTLTGAKMRHVKSHIGSENDVEAWLLLASISENTTLRKMEIYNDYYELAWKSSGVNDGFLASLSLQVLRNCWSSFDDDSLRRIQADMSKHLSNYEIRAVLISHCLDILYGVTKHLAEFPSLEKRTMRNLMRHSESTILRVVESGGGSEVEDPENLLFRATCTLGHASFLCCDKISTASLRTLQGFLLERNSLPEAVRSRKELQGAAIMVLGQQALRDRDVAQEMTPIFGRLLRNSTEYCRGGSNENIASGPAVRINAAKALADICVRFTSLVEPYLSDMCVSMKDPDPEVRQVILVIFIQLLVEDFIKINGAFFFHILTMLADSDSTIREMTMFLIKERLMTKNKSLMNQQLVQSIFHFNDYERRTVGSRRNPHKDRALTLSGDGNSEKRRMIYDFMVEHLDPPGKLAVVGTLTKQIFSQNSSLATSIEELDFKSEKGRCILRDAIYVASSDHLQPSSCGKQANDDENLEEGSQSTSAAHSAIIEAMKKHRLHVLLPRLVELKRKLARRKSPLHRDVTKFIGKLIGDYSKDQLAAFHNEYPKFEVELERDLRLSEKDPRKEKVPEDQEATRTREIDASCEASTSSGEPSPRINSTLINFDRTPRIVLRRLSTLTYPGISTWPSQIHPDPIPEAVARMSPKVAASPTRKNQGNSSKSSSRIRSRSSTGSRESMK